MGEDRTVRIDAGFYEVEVEGASGDDLEDVRRQAFEAAERARKDVEEMDDRLEDGDKRQYS